MGPVEPRRLLEETEAELSHSGRDLAGWREVRDLEEHMKKIWKGGPVTGTKQGHEPAGGRLAQSWGDGEPQEDILKIMYIGNLSAELQIAAKSTGRRRRQCCRKFLT